MKKVLIIDTSLPLYFSEGKLGQTIIDKATEIFEKSSIEVRHHKITEDDSNYSKIVDDMVWADFIMYQIPTFWMGTPWTFKKFQDMAWDTRLFEHDGRHSNNHAVGYGTGGKLKDKRYMISCTWNAPKATFVTPGDFGYEAGGIDGVFMPFHKSHEFIGMHKVSTFMVNDVIKNPTVDKYLHELEIHFDRYLGLKIRDDLYK